MFLTPQASRIREDGFDTIEDMGTETLEDDDIRELATTFSSFPASRHVSFGTARAKRLFRIMCWVQDYERTSLSASFPSGTTQLQMSDT